MIDEKEVLEKMGEIGKAVKEARDMAENAEKAVGKLEGLDKEKVEKALDSAGKLVEQVQEMKAKHVESEKATVALGEEHELLKKELYARKSSGDNDVEDLLYSQKFNYFLRKGINMNAEEIAGFAKEHSMKAFKYKEGQEVCEKDLIAGIKPDGGYWVQPERSSQIVSRIFETSPVRQVANVVTSSTDTMEFIIDDNEASSGGWVGETESRGETDTPKIGLLTIPIHEQFAQPIATQKMLDDAGFDVEAWLAGKIQDKLTRTENTAFVLGDGSKKPQGFLTLPAWAQSGVYEREAIEQIASGSAGVLTTDGLRNTQGALKEFYQSGSAWLMKRDTWTQATLLKDDESRFLINLDFLKEGTDFVLLGKRVILADDIPVVAGDSLSVVYGNFGMGYTIVDRFGFRVIRDNITTKGKIKFYTTKRVGAAVTNFEALKINKMAA